MTASSPTQLDASRHQGSESYRHTLAIALAVIAGLAILAVYYFFYYVEFQKRIMHAAEQIRTLTESVTRLYANDPNRYSKFDGDNIASKVISLGGAPADMVAGSGLVGVWGNPVSINGWPGKFSIYYFSVPTGLCVELARNPPMIKGTITGNSAPIPLPSPESVAAAACATPGSKNNVVWTSQ